MKIIILAIFIVFASSSFAEDFVEINTFPLEVPSDPDKWIFNGDNDKNRGGRVSNGRQASNTQFPWVGEMSINTRSGGGLCTSSLISTYWLLTAKHCIEDVVSARVSMGSASRLDTRVTRFAASFTILSGSNPPDIALFKLTQSYSLNSYINTVRLPSRSQANRRFEGYEITAAGWGGIGNNRLSNYLQYTTFRVLTLSQCNYGSSIICSRPASGTASLEGGDSGGPSVIYESGIPTLVGVNVFYVVTSNGRLQGSTNVAFFLDFINKVTGIALRN